FCRPPRSPLVPYTTLFRSDEAFGAGLLGLAIEIDGMLEADVLDVPEPVVHEAEAAVHQRRADTRATVMADHEDVLHLQQIDRELDRKSTRLNSSHVKISYA